MYHVWIWGPAVDQGQENYVRHEQASGGMVDADDVYEGISHAAWSGREHCSRRQETDLGLCPAYRACVSLYTESGMSQHSKV